MRFVDVHTYLGSSCVLGIISGKLLSPAVLHPHLLITTGAGHVLLLGQTRAGVTSWGTTGLSEHPELTKQNVHPCVHHPEEALRAALK